MLLFERVLHIGIDAHWCRRIRYVRRRIPQMVMGFCVIYCSKMGEWSQREYLLIGGVCCVVDKEWVYYTSKFVHCEYILEK